jgi:oligopeptide transport system permease protein
MTAFILRRLLTALPVLFIVVSLTFLFMRLAPGSPFSADRKLPESIELQLKAKYKLDGTLWEQYTGYLGDVMKGDLRLSTKYRNRTVTEILAQMLPVSLTLGCVAFILAMAIGIPLGAIAGINHNKALDRAAMLAALAGISVPGFIVAPFLILLFAVHLGWLPVAGWGSPEQIVLPAFCLALPFAASIARLTRGSLVEVMGQDFIRTARAKGLTEPAIFYRHAAKIALLPVLSYSGPLAANLLTGSIVIETIFRIPGLGPFFINSIMNRDLFVVGGTVLVYCSFLILLNLLVDVLYFFFDRRIKAS